VTIITAVAADNHPEIRRKEAADCVALLRRPSGGKLKPYSKQIFDRNPTQPHAPPGARSSCSSDSPRHVAAVRGAELILACIAWQEPNVIPIKDFFHDDNRAPRRNYFDGMLASDAGPARARWLLANARRLLHQRPGRAL